MSNGNDDWGSGGDSWPGQQSGQQSGGGQGHQPGQPDQDWGQPPSAPPRQPGMPQQPGPPQPQGGQQEPAWGQPPNQQQAEPDPWQQVGQQPGQGPGQPQPQGNMVHKGGGGGPNKLETNDIVAMIASFLLPGVGHMILGQTTRGLVILAGILLTCGAGYIVSLIVVADCYFVAMTQKYREVGDWELFPDYNDHI